MSDEKAYCFTSSTRRFFAWPSSLSLGARIPLRGGGCEKGDGCGEKRPPHQTRSMASAMPWPTPMHIVHSARLPPVAIS